MRREKEGRNGSGGRSGSKRTRNVKKSCNFHWAKIRERKKNCISVPREKNFEEGLKESAHNILPEKEKEEATFGKVQGWD